jgi:predicted nucleic acid-binding protein
MKIVSNTGPIIGLAKIGLLFILNQMASEVLIPPMVHKELLGKIGEESEQIEKALKEFIHVKDFSPADPATENAVSDLDEGERQVLRLASSIGGDVLVLMDDHAGRQVANRLNISVSGVVGLLLLAKEKGILEKIASLLEKLRTEGYWLSDEVIKISKEIAGEI